MKKFNILFFIIPILYGALVFGTDGISALGTAPETMLCILVLLIAGIAMQKGKVWSAYLGIAFGVFWIAQDIISAHIRNGYRLFPVEYVCVPLIIYYIYCAIAVKTKPDKK